MLRSSSVLTGRNRTNMHVQSGDGTSPLIDAVQSNQLESCKLLLKYGGKFCSFVTGENCFISQFSVIIRSDQI
jgi:hypothetical protein